MKLYIVDAFTTQRFGGNQAGVALVEEFPEEGYMRALAGELKHSETAFVRPLGQRSFQVRYFTPTEEVELCGHATIAAFTVLRETGVVSPGVCTASTLAGELEIQVEEDAVWMEMASPQQVREFSAAECAELYEAYGLSSAAQPSNLAPAAVKTGLCDILLPVGSLAELNGAVQNEAAVTALSQRYHVVGVHMFWVGGEAGRTAHCRNFAPLYAIPEEAATGTSNGGLTYYLYKRGLVTVGVENRFLQGEHMGRPSEIRSRLTQRKGKEQVQIGGPAVLMLNCETV